MNKEIIFLILLLCSSVSYSQFAKSKIWDRDPHTSAKYLINDFNGDGLSDKLTIKQDGKFSVALSNGNSFNPEQNWGSYDASSNLHFYSGDFNGDGMSDIAIVDNLTGTCSVSITYQDPLNGKYYFTEPAEWSRSNFLKAAKHYIGDFNGDGFNDIMSYSDVWYVSTSNGTSFNPASKWKNSETSDIDLKQIFVSDFDGDGFSDITIFKEADSCSTGKNIWLTSLAKHDSTFSSFSCWSSGDEIKTSEALFLDLNGDRKIDKINLMQGNKNFVSLSSGKDFYDERKWLPIKIEDSIFFAGDFNGDNLFDIASLSPKGEWSVRLNELEQDKIVGVWYTNWYWPGCGLWSDSSRDPKKIPIVGWPDNQPKSGKLYSSKDTAIINLQIDAMIKSGINLIVIDYTNGWKNYKDSTKWEDDSAHAATDALFWVMNNRRVNHQKYIKVAFGLGKEFWGPRSFKSLGWKWQSWFNQYRKQKNALDEIYSLYVKRYPDIFFNYLNKPLIITWLWIGDDFPPKENGTNIPLWHFNNFTLRKAVNWSSTSSQRAGPISGVTDVFIDGQDSKRFWGWGAEKDMPFNKECMSVMPGTVNWPSIHKTGHSAVRNRNENGSGSYYIESWKRVIEAKPNMVLICDWNNWNEETAIEGCIGENSWQDLNGNKTFDWYLKITKYYSNIFSTNSLLPEIYVEQEGDPTIYKWKGNFLEKMGKDYKPFREPIIKLPAKWLIKYGYLE